MTMWARTMQARTMQARTMRGSTGPRWSATPRGARRWRALAAATLLLAGAGLAACSDDEGADSPGGADTDATTPGAPDGSNADGTFNVLAYNVAGLPVEISDQRPDLNLPIISPLLEDFDIVLTQEDFDWWQPDGLASTVDFVNYHDRLRADTTHEHRSGPHPGPEAVELDLDQRPEPELGDGLGTLSRFPIEEPVRVPWTSCFGGIDASDGGAADCLAMKGFSLTRTTLDDGVIIDVYNLHGEAGGTEEDQRLQADNFAQLAAFIADTSEGNAIVLGGDTNLHTNLDHPDGSDGADIEIWDTFLEATELVDACDATECDHPGRIDKFAFRSGGRVELEALEYGFQTETFVDEAGEDLSDHQALELVLSWTRS